ncbi:aminotransferase class V-fold PLP-dependent enzyme [Aliagarivorans taiwanensis]|uniref:aminotransferase class V-fold PLP-dependent enzyme n=1 Tax=Aliagarivorans taiwanensis TaxID=561966 RepID=UPI00047C10BB|nr:cysteine desulfurase [Aliagarivorans taiwanensis]
MSQTAFRSLFPCFSTKDRFPVYLDSAASTQLPQSVIDAQVNYCRAGHANVNRSGHTLARQATDKFNQTRQLVAAHIGAQAEQLIWTSGTTDAINTVASGLTHLLTADDEIWTTELEHHANLVTWQQLAATTGASLRYIPVLENGDLDIAHFEAQLSKRCKLVAIAHVSNTTGTINPVARVARLAQQFDAKVLVDGAQAVAHLKVDVNQLDCDYYVFSGHKMYGPTGIGALYGKPAALDALQPSKFGGEMISKVSLSGSEWNQLPYRLEAGTPNIIGALGMGAAAQFLADIEFNERHRHERQLLSYALQQLSTHPEVELLAKPMLQTSVIAFRLRDIHPQDAATLLDQQGIALRCGHHCAMPLSAKLSDVGSLRISFGLYNEPADVDALMQAIDHCVELLGDD